MNPPPAVGDATGAAGWTDPTLAAALAGMADPFVIARAVRDEEGICRDLEYVFANPAACQYNRTTREALVGSRVLALLPAHESSGLLAAYARVLSSGEPLHLADFTYAHERQGGEPRRFDLHAWRIDDCVAVTWRDVTETRTAVELAELTMHRAPIGMCIVSREGRFLDVNDSLCEFLGSDRAALRNRTWADFTHPDDMARDLSSIRQIALGQSNGFSVRKRYLLADGTIKHGELSLAAVRDDAGEVRYLIAQVVDRTAQAHVEAELEAERQLRAVQTRYRAVVSALGAGVVVRDRSGTLVEANEAAGRILGVSPASLLSDGIPFSRWQPCDASGAPIPDGELFRLVDGQGTPAVTELVVGLMLEQGRRSWLLVNAVPIREGEQAGSVVVSFTDITSLRAAMQDAQEARERFAGVVDALGDQVYVLDPVFDAGGEVADFIVAQHNPAAARELITQASDVIAAAGGRLSLAYPEAATSGLLEGCRTALQTGRIVQLAGIGLHWPGSLARGRVHDVAVVRFEGPRGPRLAAIAHDVTEELAAQRELELAEERFRLLAENSSDVVLRIAAGRVEWISPSVADLLGWQREDVTGGQLVELLAGASPDQVDQLLADCVLGPVVGRLHVQARDGGWHWIGVSAKPYLDSGGHHDGYVLSMRSVDADVHAEQELARRANFDDLTGALKREEALRRLAELTHSRRRADGCAIVFCDIDSFKSVNDTWGHTAGDELLRTTVQRVREVVRSSDMVARMGGDEFLVVLESVRDLAHAESICEKLRGAAAQPVPGSDVRATVSIGVTLSVPGEPVDSMIQRADEAMYEAKRAGRDRVVAAPLGDLSDH